MEGSIISDVQFMFGTKILQGCYPDSVLQPETRLDVLYSYLLHLLKLHRHNQAQHCVEATLKTSHYSVATLSEKDHLLTIGTSATKNK